MTRTNGENDIWQALQHELDDWQGEGRTATFWWRDDDAVQHTEQLEQLDQISRTYRAPLSIAVIPAGLQPSLIEFITKRGHITVLQHGYAHQSHARNTGKKIEIGGSHTAEEIEDELHTGFERLNTAFGEPFVPVLVPPWNRIDKATYPLLLKVGFTGLSSMWARERAFPIPGLHQVNCHLDPVNWRHDRGIIGEHLAIEHIQKHLLGRRTGTIDGDEPTGILTHHLVQTEDVWALCSKLFSVINAHPAANWLDAKTIWQSTAGVSQ